MNENTRIEHRILIVDDNEAIHGDFSKVLGKDREAQAFDLEEAKFFGEAPAEQDPGDKFFDLDFALQGQEALEKVKSATEAGRPYSIAFMDIRMPPGWDGIETTTRLWEVSPDLQVVICTAYSDYSWDEMASKLGRSDKFLILKKPFDAVEVIQCAHALARKSELIRESRLHAQSLETRVLERTSELNAANRRLENEIAERRKSEDALRFTQFSVDNTADGNFWVAPDGRITYANRSICENLGYAVSELHSLSAMDILPEIRGWGQFWETMRKTAHMSLECAGRAKDGTLIPYELTANYLRFGERELLSVSARNISERIRVHEELSQARDEALASVRMKSRFLATMSHEIRTPMNGIIGMAELLSDTRLERDQRDQLDTIRKSADLLMDIINSILDSSKIESGTLDFRDEVFDIHRLVEGAVDIVASTARAKRLELGYVIAADVFPALRGDSGRIRQVLTNLLSNAVKFTEKGEVILSITRTAETETSATLEFRIRDTGIGISKKALSRIFDPFIQADDSDNRNYGGTGLGLSISRQIVEAIGGSIGVESTLGQGSEFRFTLGFKKHAIPEGSVQPASSFPKELRALIVDDNATNREILRLQLDSLNIRSRSAPSGEEALSLLAEEHLKEDPFHVAVLDMEMPGMNGTSLAKSIRDRPCFSDLSLVLLGSLGDQLDPEELKNTGIGAHLLKPVKQRQLAGAIRSALGGETPRISPQPAANGGAPATGSLRILIAEDNPVNIKVTLLQLRKLGYSADVAEDGAKALAAATATRYDIILMDCQMPVMDGFEATRRIKASQTDPPFIIAMTAGAMEGYREKCLASGMDEYVSKPISLESLGKLLGQHGSATPRSPCPVDIDRFLEITAGDEDIFRQISGDFIDQASEILELISEAIKEDSMDEVRRLAHKLRGSSSICGMIALVDPLDKLEHLPPDPASAAQLHAEAVAGFAAIRSYLANHLEQHHNPQAK